MEEGVAGPAAAGGGGAGDWPKGNGLEPNALLENGVTGASPPNEEPADEPPNGFCVALSPFPNTPLETEVNGELAGAAVDRVVPKGDLLSPPPPNADVAGAAAAGVVPNGNALSPPPLKADVEEGAAV